MRLLDLFSPPDLMLPMCSRCPSEPASDKPLSLPGRGAIALIWLYRHSLSLVMGRGCRYAPSCSDYTEQAIRTYGFWAGGWIGLARILRCNPFGASGFDPVPDALPEGARWYRPWRYGRWTGRHIPEKFRLDEAG